MNSLIGHVAIGELAPADVEWMLDELGQNYSGHTVRGALRVLRTMTRDAQAEFGLVTWACARVAAPAVGGYTEEEPNLLFAEEVSAVLGAMNPVVRCITSLMMFTGLRFCEASAIKWTDVDDEHGCIRIHRSQYRGVVAERTKTGKSRTVPMGPHLAEILRDHRKKLLEQQHPGLESGWVFPSRKGTPLYTGALSSHVAKAAKAAGVSRRVTPHGLRRSFNNLVRQVEADTIVIKSITGHSTEAMREHYSHVSIAEKQTAQGKVLSLLRPDVGIHVGTSENEESLAQESEGS